MGNLKHIKTFNESDDIVNELNVKVKHIIQYLQDNFDLESSVYLDTDGWCEDELDAKDEIDLISKRGIFYNFNGSLFISN
jgi:hypothetical protein